LIGAIAVLARSPDGLSPLGLGRPEAAKTSAQCQETTQLIEDHRVHDAFAGLGYCVRLDSIADGLTHKLNQGPHALGFRP
jgi:hypothetical protein